MVNQGFDKDSGDVKWIEVLGPVNCNTEKANQDLENPN